MYYFQSNFTDHAENFNNKLVQENKKLLLLRDSHQSTILYVYIHLIFTVHAKNFNNKFVEETKTIAFA
jgi:hypothetical protein